MESCDNRFVYPKSVWWMIVAVIVVLFCILYEFPMLGLFNNYPGQQLNYILGVNVLYFIVSAWVGNMIVRSESGKGGCE
ncbi:MAG: hypothetical protein ACM3X4_01705 [Ignavibacteriales bacterium]